METIENTTVTEKPRGFFDSIFYALGFIAGPRGFFGPGFFKDFSEGFKESWNQQPQEGGDDYGYFEEMPTPDDQTVWGDGNVPPGELQIYAPGIHGQFDPSKHFLPSWHNSSY